jgi:pyruvate,orthophosphate dikinase
MYSNVVLNIGHDTFEHILDDYKESRDFNLDTDLGAESWIEVIALYKKAVEKRTRQAVPAGAEGSALGRHRRRVSSAG